MVGAGSNGSSLVNKSVGHSPIVQIKIADIIIPCILDTGSMISTISETFFYKALQSKFDLHPDQGWLRLRAANELDISYVGYIETDVFVASACKTIRTEGF